VAGTIGGDIWPYAGGTVGAEVGHWGDDGGDIKGAGPAGTIPVCTPFEACAIFDATAFAGAAPIGCEGTAADPGCGGFWLKYCE
jgi:hypothetical protein